LYHVYTYGIAITHTNPWTGIYDGLCRLEQLQLVVCRLESWKPRLDDDDELRPDSHLLSTPFTIIDVVRSMPFTCLEPAL
jgi:hypothetical protein